MDFSRHAILGQIFTYCPEIYRQLASLLARISRYSTPSMSVYAFSSTICFLQILSSEKIEFGPLV